MNKRATASPKEAEEERVVARKRSTARRAAYTPDELQRQRASARQRKWLRKSGKHQQEKVKTKLHASDNFEWPKSVEIEHKKNCLKNFIQHMSMSFLEEGVCGICNVRCYKRDLHHIPFSKIPSIELLKVPDDFYDIIPGMQEKHQFQSHDKLNMSGDLAMALIQKERAAG